MVRTSLDPALQAAAERSRARRADAPTTSSRGGWRGPVTHLDRPARTLAHRLGGSAAGQVARPPGMLPDWRLGVVLETTDSEAKLGWLDAGRPGEPGRCRRQPRMPAMLPLSDVAWARPVKDGKLGPAPRRMADVVKPGDVVMVEPTPRAAATSRRRQAAGRRHPVAAAGAERLVLRQIPQVQGALVSLDPTTGRVLAMVGGWSFEHEPVQPRDPGEAPAGVELQAVRLPDRAGAGHLAQPALPGCAGAWSTRAGTASGGRTTSSGTSAARRRCAWRWSSR